MLRAVSSHLRPEHWTYEAELLAVLDMAGFLFSLGLRMFVAFGLLVRPLCSHSIVAFEEWTNGSWFPYLSCRLPCII